MDATRPPLGAHWDPVRATWTISVWAPGATALTVELSARSAPGVVTASVAMRRDGDVWRAVVPAATAGDAELYGVRADGPWDPRRGRRFDPTKVLVDPYARRVLTPGGDRVAARALAATRGADTGACAPRAVLPRTASSGSSGSSGSSATSGSSAAARATVAPGDEIVYEAHVRGYTMTDPTVRAGRRGTLAGLIDRLDHMVALGVTVLELLPVHAGDPGEGSYWGYMPLAWLALDDARAANGDAATELAELCAAAAARGIAVWLDVVYNHSTEEHEHGPTWSLRGLADGAYYVLRPDGTYVDDAGTGNIVRAAHPAAADLILASLERLADLGVAGFRFDLASILGRDLDGAPQARSALCDRISAWAAARGVRLVAEAWDVATYQVGDAFPGRDWAQWNDRFRDDVRGFLRGEEGLVPALVQRVQGSPDLFPGAPTRSVNFVTAHDGFTLYDLVSYDRKHNEANGWGGADGTDDNRSWNCGVEGDVGLTAEIRDLRGRQMRNALVILLWSAGVPMLVAGDEFARTQGGNNNPYNQDNATSWVAWERLAEWADLHRFTAALVALRRRASVVGRVEPWGSDVTFFGARGPVDDQRWSRSLGWHLHPGGGPEWAVIANAWWEPLDFALPGSGWSRVVDTSLPSPADIVEPGREVPVPGSSCAVGPRSCVVLTRSPPGSDDRVG